MNVYGSAKILTNVQTFRDCALQKWPPHQNGHLSVMAASLWQLPVHRGHLSTCGHLNTNSHLSTMGQQPAKLDTYHMYLVSVFIWLLFRWYILTALGFHNATISIFLTTKILHPWRKISVILLTYMYLPITTNYNDNCLLPLSWPFLRVSTVHVIGNCIYRLVVWYSGSGDMFDLHFYVEHCQSCWSHCTECLAQRNRISAIYWRRGHLWSSEHRESKSKNRGN